MVVSFWWITLYWMSWRPCFLLPSSLSFFLSFLGLNKRVESWHWTDRVKLIRLKRKIPSFIFPRYSPMCFGGAKPFSQLAVLTNDHFVKLSFYHFIILLTWHSINLVFGQITILKTCHFVKFAFHQFAVWSNNNFICLPFCLLAIMSKCHFVYL